MDTSSDSANVKSKKRKSSSAKDGKPKVKKAKKASAEKEPALGKHRKDVGDKDTVPEKATEKKRRDTSKAEKTIKKSKLEKETTKKPKASAAKAAGSKSPVKPKPMTPAEKRLRFAETHHTYGLHGFAPMGTNASRLKIGQLEMLADTEAVKIHIERYTNTKTVIIGEADRIVTIGFNERSLIPSVIAAVCNAFHLEAAETPPSVHATPKGYVYVGTLTNCPRAILWKTTADEVRVRAPKGHVFVFKGLTKPDPKTGLFTSDRIPKGITLCTALAPYYANGIPYSLKRSEKLFLTEWAMHTKGTTPKQKLDMYKDARFPANARHPDRWCSSTGQEFAATIADMPCFPKSARKDTQAFRSPEYIASVDGQLVRYDLTIDYPMTVPYLK